MGLGLSLWGTPREEDWVMANHQNRRHLMRTHLFLEMDTSQRPPFILGIPPVMSKAGRVSLSSRLPVSMSLGFRALRGRGSDSNTGPWSLSSPSPSPSCHVTKFAHPLAVRDRALEQGMVGLPSLLHLDSCLNVSILALTFGALERDKRYIFLLQAVESQWNIVDDFFTETTDDFKESVEAQGKNVGKVGAEAWGDQVVHP